MYSAADGSALPEPGFPIRKSPDLRLLAATRSLSQPATSFIASRYQGIHRTPLVAWPKILLENRPGRYSPCCKATGDSTRAFASVIIANYPDAQYSIFKELQPLAQFQYRRERKFALTSYIVTAHIRAVLSLVLLVEMSRRGDRPPPCLRLVEMTGIEPAPSALQKRRSPY